ncbi:MAG: hypothetical protein UY63_C0001G0031 [Parcubacteria group bacterium GW2011_GWA2_51_10]|nr:MAG: hypothetical protein UY63_C0001G0031 [Parcubacteria group bacterium GW2011_GWA2_51_10]
MERPGVGVGVCIKYDGKVLFGKRKNCVGAGMWGFPGGHLEMYEDPADCAKREILEETGLELENVRYAGYTNTFQHDIREHYVTLYFSADSLSGDARNAEPDKCDALEWREWDRLPAPLFWATRKFVETGYNPFNL